MAVEAHAASTEMQHIVGDTGRRRFGGHSLAGRIRMPRVTDRGMLFILMLGVALVGWPSLSSLLPQAGGDTPVSFVPLVPFIGAGFMLALCDGSRIRSSPRDGFIDGVCLVVLAIAALAVLLVLPTSMSWYYWLDRLDIVGLILVLAATIVFVWGVPGLVRLGPGLLYMFLAWPLPYLKIYNWLIPSLTSATSTAARIIAPLLPLAIQAPPQRGDLLVIPYHGQPVILQIAQECAGINGALGLVVVGLPLAILGRGTWASRLSWLALGLCLSWLVNLFRILVIAAGIGVLGPNIAMNWMHPALGLILFAISFAVLIALAPLLRLDIASVLRPASRTRSRDQVVVLRWKRLVGLGAILGTSALLESNLNQFGWLSESSLPRIGSTSAADLVHLPTGWRIAASMPLDGWQPIFGPASVSSMLVLQGPEKPYVYVQAVLSKDLNTFSTYGVEQCYLFHGYTLQTAEHLSLGNGVTATLIDFQEDGGARAVSLYWIQPVRTHSGLYHERIVVGTELQPFLGMRSLRIPAGNVHGPVVGRISDALMDFFSPWGGRSELPAYDLANRYVEWFSQSMIARESKR